MKINLKQFFLKNVDKYYKTINSKFMFNNNKAYTQQIKNMTMNEYHGKKLFQVRFYWKI